MRVSEVTRSIWRWRRKHRRYPAFVVAAGFVVAFALVGVVTLLLTRAATPTAHIEPENGVVSSGASIRADGTASGGSYVEFGSGQPGSAIPCQPHPSDQACWASNTGVRGYTKAQIVAGQTPFQHLTGQVVLGTAGQVFENKWVDGCIAIRANNVTIRNVLVRGTCEAIGGNGMAAPSVINIGNPNGGPGTVSGLVIEDTEVDGMNGRSFGISAVNYTLRRVNVHGFISSWPSANVTITDSYFHNSTTDTNGDDPATCLHIEALMASSSQNVTIDHTWLSIDTPFCNTGAINAGADWGPTRNFTLTNSYIGGNNGAGLHGSCNNTGMVVTDNVFGPANHYMEAIPTSAVWARNVDLAGNPVQRGGC